MSESDIDTEWEDQVKAEMKCYEENINDHVFYIHVKLRCCEGNEYDSLFDIKEDDLKLPIIKIVEWFKERYEDVKSFDICYEWKLSLFYGKHLFKISYTPEEMADYLDIGNEYYLFTDMIPDMMDNVLEFADSDGNYPLTYHDTQYLVFGRVFCHDILIEKKSHRMQHILAIGKEDHQKKKILFEELIPKAWHPDRALRWCICE